MHHEHPAALETTPEVGLDEHLGNVIPLDATFRDEQGRQVKLSELITVPTLIAPVYFSCPNVCSFLQGDLARVLPQIRLTPGKDYRVLSISFDDRDGPAEAAKARQTYRTAMNAPFPEDGWRFLTGDEVTIRRVLDTAGYRFARRGEDFLHPVAVFVVTPDGRIVRYLHGTRMLPLDVTLAFTEAAEGRLGGTIRKVVQFCFSYDPAGRRYVFNLLRVSAVAVLLTAGGFGLYLVLSNRKKTKI
jgi:protein SCO1/2